MIEKFQFSGRDLAVITANKVKEVLVANQHLCHHCDPQDDPEFPPAGNSVWGETELYICTLDGLWMNATYVASSDGSGFHRVVLKEDKLFVLPDKTVAGVFYEFYRSTQDW